MNKNHPVSKEQLIENAKSDETLKKIIDKLHLSDEEIFYKFIDLMNIKLRELNPDDYIDQIELIRNEKGLLETKRYFANNNKYRKYLIYNNIIFKNLGFIMYNKTFSELIFKEEEFYDLYNYQKDFKETLENPEKFKKLKGFFLHSFKWNDRCKLFSGLAQEIALSDRKVAYVNVEYLLDEIKSSFSKNSEKEPDFIINEIMKCDVVIFDNLGYDKLPKWFFKSLTKILNYRSLYNKLTYFGSKIPLNEIASIFEESHNKDIFIRGQIQDFVLAIKNLIECEAWIE
ncbi:hypothetical protein NPA08_02420 [Mycoplasmopsis citelli]|uniref:DNA replication protein n=1 Tax=Mycoplasmopsis citelli TaxID=171281 RepID=A0A449B151_9BACT|nr:hypothetical protein [Mycoplasmopsis citelli]UUD35800.1 hypothetical protein NPA08_02420 [Mycoplasmopsis citelli]VEU74330.1 DNA replication protein [Mycoplasmopsis citelli]